MGPSSIGDRRLMSVCVSESWYLIHRQECSVMVTGIVGHASLLLDDDSFCIPRTPRHRSIQGGLYPRVAEWFPADLWLFGGGPSQLDAVDREAAYSINLPSSIDSFAFVSRGEAAQDEP
jgi:hypothetical protein